jgi:hypothetical protein
MKKLKGVTALTLGLCLVFNLYLCKNSSSDSKKVTKTFEADIIGSNIYYGPDTLLHAKCPDSLPFRIIVDGKGTSNIMGDIQAHFDFCGNEQGYYGGKCYSYFVDKNSDTLFISGEGKVIEGKTDEHPPFVTSYWKDDIEIIGGTGKFEGATGKCKTDDYNSSEDPYSHHHWKGTITLIKERE